MARRFYAREDFEEVKPQSELPEVSEPEPVESELPEVSEDTEVVSSSDVMADELVEEALENYLMSFEEYQEVRNELLSKIGYVDHISDNQIATEKQEFKVGGNLFDKIQDFVFDMIKEGSNKAYKIIRSAKRWITSNQKDLKAASDKVRSNSLEIVIPESLKVGGHLNTGKGKTSIQDIIKGLEEFRDLGLWLSKDYSKKVQGYAKDLITKLRSGKWYKNSGPTEALVNFINIHQDIVIPAHPKATKGKTEDLGEKGKIVSYSYGPLIGDLVLDQTISTGEHQAASSDDVFENIKTTFGHQTTVISKLKNTSDLEFELSDKDISPKDLARIIDLCNEIVDICDTLHDERKNRQVIELASKVYTSLYTLNIDVLFNKIVVPNFIGRLFLTKGRRLATQFTYNLVYTWTMVPFGQYSSNADGIVRDALKLVDKVAK